MAAILMFRGPRRQCRGCGQIIAAGDSCPKCRAWDALLRAMSLRRQALGMLARVGG